MAGETGSGFATDLGVGDAAVTAGCTLVLAGYASWIAADALPRWLAFLAVALGAGYALLRVDDRRTRVGTAAYALAGLLALTPVALIVPDALWADELGVSALSMVLTTGNAILVVVFLALAAAVGYLGYRFGGPRPRVPGR